MAHVFAGEPDARQSAEAIPVSRFRPQYRALTNAEKALHDAIKTKATELESLIEHIKPGRYRALGITALEESVMWVIKELTGAGIQAPDPGKAGQAMAEFAIELGISDLALPHGGLSEQG